VEPAGNNQISECLGEQLSERTRIVNSVDSPAEGEFVLYWLHHAMRAHENPALDVAISLSDRLGLPLVVYQSLPEAYPYASDRHHRFILEGAGDLQQQFQQREIDYCFHLEMKGQPGPHLPHLAGRAAVVVTEDIPVSPIRDWTQELQGVTTAPLLAVDTACVVPMRLVGKAFDRAFQFRQATQPLYSERVVRGWQELEPQYRFPKIDLPFKGLDLARALSATSITRLRRCLTPWGDRPPGMPDGNTSSWTD